MDTPKHIHALASHPASGEARHVCCLMHDKPAKPHVEGA